MHIGVSKDVIDAAYPVLEKQCWALASCVIVKSNASRETLTTMFDRLASVVEDFETHGFSFGFSEAWCSISFQLSMVWCTVTFLHCMDGERGRSDIKEILSVPNSS
jgi:hypothetical protein